MKTTKMLTILVLRSELLRRVALVLTLGLILCQAEVSEAGPMGTAFTYQGHLYDNNDVADGEYDLKFTLYDANEGGSQLAGPIEVNDCNVIDGYFAVELDFGSSVFDGNAVWLETTVAHGDGSNPCTLSPRQEVTPTPYAIYAKTAGGISGGGGVASGFYILGDSKISPPGYTYTGNYVRTQAAWSEKTPMPTARGSLTAAVVNGRIYAIGGYSEAEYTAVNEEYDPATNTWAIKAPMPTARSSLAAAGVNGKIYAIGGYEGFGSHLDKNEEYDPVTNTWAIKAPMPTARSFLAAAVVSNKIYAIGGYVQPSYLSTNEEYNPATNTWATMADMTSARRSHAAAVLNNVIHVFGGQSPGRILAKHESYAPSSPSWFVYDDMPTPRYQLAAVELDNKIYVIGGSDGFKLARNEVYHSFTHSWSTGPDMLTARNGLAAAVVNGKIYVFGGYNQASLILSNTEEFDPDAQEQIYHIHRKD